MSYKPPRLDMSKILELSAAMLPRAAVPASAHVQYFVKPTAQGRNLTNSSVTLFPGSPFFGHQASRTELNTSHNPCPSVYVLHRHFSCLEFRPPPSCSWIPASSRPSVYHGRSFQTHRKWSGRSHLTASSSPFLRAVVWLA